MDVDRAKNEILAKIEELKNASGENFETLNFIEQAKAFCRSKDYEQNVVFMVGPDKKRAIRNREILAQKSKVFSQLFFGELSENPYIVELPYDDPESFEELLKFIVENKVDLSLDNVFQVYLAAQKYDITDLESKCLFFIRANMKVEDAFLILYQIQNIEQPALEKLALMKLEREVDKAIKMPQFLSLSQKYLIEFLKRCQYAVFWSVLFKYVFQWAHEECERQNIDPSVPNNIRVLGDAFQFIKSLLSTQSLLKICQEEGDLTKEEIDAIQNSPGTDPAISLDPKYDYEKIIRIAADEIHDKKFMQVTKNLKHDFRLEYNVNANKYTRPTCSNFDAERFKHWDTLAFSYDNVVRHIENDHGKVYLAREDGIRPGEIIWKVDLFPAHVKKVTVTLDGQFECNGKTCRHSGCLRPKDPGCLETTVTCNGVVKEIKPNTESETMIFEDLSWDADYLEIKFRFSGGGNHEASHQFAQIFRSNMTRHWRFNENDIESDTSGDDDHEAFWRHERQRHQAAVQRERTHPNMLIEMDFY